MSYYFNQKTWTLTTTPPGFRVPTIAAMALAPLLGALFIMFLPVIGFWLTGQALIKRATTALNGFWALLTVRGPVPGTAHLTGTPEAKGDGLEGVSEEVSEARASQRGHLS